MKEYYLLVDSRGEPLAVYRTLEGAETSKGFLDTLYGSTAFPYKILTLVEKQDATHE